MSGAPNDREAPPHREPAVPALRRLADPIPRSGVDASARLGLRQFLADGDRDLTGAFGDGVAATRLVAARAAMVDRVALHVWRAWLGDREGMALLAVGGYGRRELFPHSDVDLLVLTAGPIAEARQQRALEMFLSTLWDIGLKPGHAVRDADGCRRLAGQDETVYSALLDARPLAGDDALGTALTASLPDQRLWTPLAFLEAKQADRAARRRRFGDTAYNLEPNLKEGPGGLRDLHLIAWLDRIAAATLLDEDERQAVATARERLFRVRYALHLEAGRPEERLLFDHQRSLAQRFGYRDESRRNLGVEQFMQRYFRATSRIAAACDDAIDRALERLEPAPPTAVPIGDGLVRIGDRIALDEAVSLEREPGRLVTLFASLDRLPGVTGLRASTTRRVRRLLRDPAFDPDRADVLAAVREVLEGDTVQAVATVSTMAHYGLLARLVPGFARVSGRMQYDLFHVYTVDEHTLRVLGFMARFAAPDPNGEFALARSIFPRLPQPSLLLLAGLFHDIAKGRGGDHSVLGVEDAQQFCAKLGLPRADIELVAWLVRWHLLMSTTAQRQDITDPEVVHRFASEVADWERLDYLYLLTVADICGTSPKLWNSWKDRLLSDLYGATRFALRERRELPPLAAERADACRDRARRLLDGRGIDAAAITRIWSVFPESSFLRYSPDQIAWQTAAIAQADTLPLVKVRPEGLRGTSEIFIHAADREGLFAAVTAVLDRRQLDIVEARVVTSRTGQVLDTFLILDAHGHTLSAEACGQIERQLLDMLERQAFDVVPAVRTLPRTLKHFQVEPRVVFRADPVRRRTRLALICTDRPGLLAAVAQALRDCKVRVHDARIVTFGERVEDFFEITDDAGAPLDAAAQESLRAVLMDRLLPAAAPASASA